MDERDGIYMARALELARVPAYTSPNPRVGAVVVKDGRIIGEGTHEGVGHPHAEARALEGVDARGATMYVSLEPCAHHGRTPPCVAGIVDAGITRVVAATRDPDELVAGKGFAAITSAGIDLEIGVLAEEAEALNAAYLHHRSTGTSFMSLKLALSLDGGLAAADGTARWITGPDARRHVHARRHEVDAILVGAATVATDDPELNVRDVPAVRQPRRIVVDASGRTSSSARVFSAGAPRMVATTERSPEEVRLDWERAGAEVLVLPSSGEGVDLHALMKVLGARDVVEVLCEGGAELATSLLSARLVQRLELHYGGVLLGQDAVRLGDLGVDTMADTARWHLESIERLGDDFVATLRPSEEQI